MTPLDFSPDVLVIGAGIARLTAARTLTDAAVFAGEASVSGGEVGTVNGAIESGERAAAEAMAPTRA